jgi:stearoyl-CoA desaturase (delta-9 desaturase)
MSKVANMEKQERGKIDYWNQKGFILMHFAPFLAFLPNVHVTFSDWMICIALYFIRMFFVTGAYHRLFSHATYKTSRAFQFFMAFGAQTSVQKGVLHWAANHRVHHKYSDTPKDPHSKKIYGFYYSHVGWILGPDYKETKFNLIKDYAKFPELVWLNKYHLVPPAILLVATYILGGYINTPDAEMSLSAIFSNGVSTLIIGIFLSTVILFHGTFSINSLMHMFGNKRYESNDESRNNLFLALITLGEGWHNNHHYYMNTVRQGFYWWEIDITYYILKIFSWVGLVWDLKPVPKHIKDSRNPMEAKELMLKSIEAKKASTTA